jgi:hypothetical protein
MNMTMNMNMKHEGDRNYNELSGTEYEERRKSGGMGFNGNNEHCVEAFDKDVCVCKVMRGNHEDAMTGECAKSVASVVARGG